MTSLESAVGGTPSRTIMNAEAEDRMTNEQQAAVTTLERMLDYAMLEGAELRSPLFVMLLRLARLALLDEFDNAGPRGNRMQKGSRPVAERGTSVVVPNQTL